MRKLISGEAEVAPDAIVVSGSTGPDTAALLDAIWPCVEQSTDLALVAKAFCLTPDPAETFRPWFARLPRATLWAFVLHVRADAALGRPLTVVQSRFLDLYIDRPRPTPTLPAGLTEIDLTPPSTDLADGQSDL